MYVGYFQFDVDDPIYTDHFPGYPVVPGSMIIDAFVTVVESIVKNQRAAGVENFRFKRFISPGCYAYRVIMEAEEKLNCALYHCHHAVVTGCVIV